MFLWYYWGQRYKKKQARAQNGAVFLNASGYLSYFCKKQIPIMEQNKEMNLAKQYVAETNVSVFLTGKAGTGKTTFLRRLRSEQPKRMVVLAPTGVAAINAQGQTIHSFFQLGFNPFIPGAEVSQADSSRYYKMGKEKKNIIRSLDLLVIDEISMVRCDLLDAVDDVLRKYRDRTKPFGGVQLLMIGDLHQLAPVAKDEEWAMLSRYYDTPYFFSSRALQQIQYVTIELHHIYRQTDASFIDLLAKIRDNRIDDDVHRRLGARYVPGFAAPKGEDWIRLTTHNYTAQRHNESELAAIAAPARRYEARIEGNFPEYAHPTDVQLELKVGAQVMFVKNDPSPDKLYYNGKIGTVLSVCAENVTVMCKGDDAPILVEPVVWENTKYVLDEETKEIKEQTDGTFTQMPLRLAWAITIHKSQGLTFDHAVLDINDSFAHGQVYVALSRCRTLEGMVLARPLDLHSVISDRTVNEYISRELSEAATAETRLPELRQQYGIMLLNEMFSFSRLMEDFRYLCRVVDEHLYVAYADFLTLMKETLPKVETHVVGVALRFQQQYNAIVFQHPGVEVASNAHLQERVKAASKYFYEQTTELLASVLAKSILTIDNAAVKKQYNNALDAFTASYKLKVATLGPAITEGFAVKSYLDNKARAVLDDVEVKKGSSRKQSASRKSSKAEGAAKEKKQKVDTRALTLEMFLSGTDIPAIAAARELTTRTIERHLAYFVGTGELDINELVSPEHQAEIRRQIATFTSGYGLKELKDKLPDDYTYSEILMVQADIK